MTYLNFIIPGHLEGAPPPEFYRQWVLRFSKSFVEFPPQSDYRLIIANTNNGMDDELRKAFVNIPHHILEYRGTGYDIGAHQHVAKMLNSDDWLMCFSSYVWFRQAGWLDNFVRAREKYGDTLYGSTASSQNQLHIRGTGFMCKVAHIQAYPITVNTKTESFDFESGPDSLTQRILKTREIYLVTPTGVHASGNMRLIPNGFRSGDQSNILTYDKHTDYYDNAPAKEREDLKQLSDGL